MKIRDGQNRELQITRDQLQQAKKKKAMQLLNDLEMRNMKDKKIKKDKIKDLIADPDKVDPDTVFEFY